MPLTSVRFDPVGSADPPISSGVAGTRASRHFWLDARLASVRPVVGDLLFQLDHRLVPVVRQPAGHDAFELAALVVPGEALEPGAAGGGAAGADGMPALLQVIGRR